MSDARKVAPESKRWLLGIRLEKIVIFAKGVAGL
jgi:hypothetical protein